MVPALRCQSPQAFQANPQPWYDARGLPLNGLSGGPRPLPDAEAGGTLCPQRAAALATKPPSWPSRLHAAACCRRTDARRHRAGAPRRTLMRVASTSRASRA
eukprot:scaffold6702_cov390-Prasinococcus_capsulatus_cf.AAC.1